MMRLQQNELLTHQQEMVNIKEAQEQLVLREEQEEEVELEDEGEAQVDPKDLPLLYQAVTLCPVVDLVTAALVLTVDMVHQPLVTPDVETQEVLSFRLLSKYQLRRCM